MKLLGLQPIDGGLAVALPSGQQILIALPEDRQRAAQVLGMRILGLLADPDEPHARQPRHDAEPPCTDEDPDLEDPLAALDMGIEAGRLVWRTLQLVSRGKR